MKSREYASVAFVVVGLLYLPYGMMLLQVAITTMDINGPLLSIAIFLPAALLFYFGFYIIRVRDRLATQVLPEVDSTETGGVSKRDLMAASFASIGLFLIGLGFPGILEVVVEVFATVRYAPGPSVMDADSGLSAASFLNVLPEAARVVTQFLFGVLLFWLSPFLATRLSGTHDGST